MTNNSRKYLSLLLCIFMLLGVLSACSPSTPQDGGDEDSPVSPGGGDNASGNVSAPVTADNRFTLNYDPESSFNPITCTSTYNLNVTSLMFDELFELGQDFSWSSDLVTEYTTQDNTWWYFYINNDITFHDGTALTAKDVEYSLQRARQFAQYSGRLDCIYGITAMDEQMLIISLDYANALLPALLNIPIIKNGTLGDVVPLGTGPYTMSESGDCLVVYEGYRYASDLPVDTVYLSAYSAAEDIITAFESHDLDLVTNSPASVYNLGFNGDNEIRYCDTTSMHYIGINMKSTFLCYPQLRCAVSYAIDRQTIASLYMSGGGEASTLPFSPSYSLYDSNYAAIYDYDYDAFLTLLRNSGVEDYDEDGVLELMTGGAVYEASIDFIVCVDSPSKVSAATFIANTLAGAGLDIKLRKLNWADYVAALTDGDYDMYYGDVKLTADFDLSSLLCDDGSLNYGNVSDPTYEAYINNYLTSTDDNRQMSFDLMCDYIARTAPIIPILFETEQIITHRDVISGITATPYNIFHNLSSWTINIG